MKESLLVIIVAFAVTFLVGLIVFPLLKRLKARQTILHYVEEHKQKAGTPTMGGIFVVAGVFITTLLFIDSENRIALISLFITLGFGIIGFLDDFIKIYFKRNMGLRAYQKAGAQLAVALVAALFVYKNIGTTIALPFLRQEIDIGFWVVPLVVVVFIAVTNGVNLTDGLDGLAGGVSVVYMSAFCVIIFLLINDAYASGEMMEYYEYKNLLVFSSAVVGAVLCFLCYNSFPAKVFMGDTGSLALGGAAASVAVFSKNSLYIPIIGIMFVASCISVIMQVGYFKATKGKRIFLMAPLHHHFQKKGMKEPKIVFMYVVITLLAALVSLAFIL